MSCSGDPKPSFGNKPKLILEPPQLIDTVPFREEYGQAGYIRSSFPLRDGALIDSLSADLVRFAVEITRNKSEGLFRVPYILTQSIINTANDRNILEVVSEVLESDELVMWGPNIQRGTPNESAFWHTDIESWFWPSVTIAVGISGCRQENSTRCVFRSHRLPVQPWAVANGSDMNDVLAAATHIDQTCNRIENFVGFESGRFYCFNARSWHCGMPQVSGEREVLFLHYQRASDPRIPYFMDYKKRTWFDFPAVYCKVHNTRSFNENLALHSTEGLDYVGPHLKYRRPSYLPIEQRSAQGSR
jgi:hypothetical protein